MEEAAGEGPVGVDDRSRTVREVEKSVQQRAVEPAHEEGGRNQLLPGVPAVEQQPYAGGPPQAPNTGLGGLEARLVE